MDGSIFEVLRDIILPLATGGLGWLGAKRKYNVEVDSTAIDNMQKSLDFYVKLYEKDQEILADMQRQITDQQRLIVLQQQEITNLRNALFNMIQSICTDLSCSLRKKELQGNILNITEDSQLKEQENKE